MTVEIRGGSEAEKGANVRFRLANLRVMESQSSICAGRVPLRPVFGPDEDRNPPPPPRLRVIALRPVFGPDEDRND